MDQTDADPVQSSKSSLNSLFQIAAKHLMKQEVKSKVDVQVLMISSMKRGFNDNLLDYDFPLFILPINCVYT